MKDLITEIRWYAAEEYQPEIHYSLSDGDAKGKYFSSDLILTTTGGKCCVVEVGHFVKYLNRIKPRFIPLDGTDNFYGLSKYWCYVPKLILPCNMR